MNIINTLLLVSYVLSKYIAESPLFYDGLLDRLCLEEIRKNIVELCNPTNCIVVDKEEDEVKNQIIFIKFIGCLDKYYTYFTKGKEKIEYERYSEEITENNCQKIVHEIVDNMEKKTKLKKFDIYFTLCTHNNKTIFFSENNIVNSINLLRDCFKNCINNESVVKYCPKGYLKYLIDIYTSIGSSKTQIFTFVDAEIVYIFFFDDSFYTNLFKRLKTLIFEYEKNMMNKINRRAEFRDKKDIDIYVLSIFYNLHKSLKDSISSSQTKFLLKIWAFLINKKGFYNIFRDIFYNLITEDIKAKLCKVFESSVNENKNLLTCEELKDVVIDSKLTFNFRNLYLFMNILSKINQDKIELKDNTTFMIKLIYYFLTKNNELLVDIFLSDSISSLIEFDKLRYENYESYEMYVIEMITNYVKYLTTDKASRKENMFFERFTSKCLNDIRNKDKKQITILKEIYDVNFKEYQDVIERKHMILFQVHRK